MMKILLIEDEQPAIDKLTGMLPRLRNDLSIVAVLTSLRESIQWLNAHRNPDLIFMDIELSDGQSFQLFDKAKIECPVIFCTAYDEYWQKAFEYNSIDYLLKPVSEEKLETALLKYDHLKAHFAQSLEQFQQFRKDPGMYKKRWLIKKGTDYISLKTEEIAFFYATHKLACLVDVEAKRYLLDKSLSEIERELNPSQFFRLNRQYLANINAIKKLKPVGKGRYLIELQPEAPDEILISAEHSPAFKDWLDA